MQVQYGDINIEDIVSKIMNEPSAYQNYGTDSRESETADKLLQPDASLQNELTASDTYDNHQTTDKLTERFNAPDEKLKFKLILTKIEDEQNMSETTISHQLD